MLPLLALGIVAGSMLGHVTGRKLAQMELLSWSGQGIEPDSSFHDQPFGLIRERVIQQESIILAVEDVPLDNRFGNRVLVSEHEFTRTATSTLKIARNHDLETDANVDLKLLESMVKNRIAHTIGAEVSGHVNRRIRLKFEADPGKFVHYRVVWKQESRRGILELERGNQIHQLPYMVAYGLFHSVESLPTSQGDGGLS